MSLFSKLKTLTHVLTTRGVRGVYQVIAAKLDHSFRPDEALIIFDLLKNSPQPGLMIDVGAHHGSSLAPFAEIGWQIIAFEPDSQNRHILSTKFAALKNVIIDPRACSDQIQSQATFYSSRESSGVSGLSAFLNSHQPSEKVVVTTLENALESYDLIDQPVDFLKVDTEGFDLMVLRGYPWESRHHPRVILCEFENAKTEPLGYTFDDQAAFLLSLGYQLIISEWYPVRAYGGVHRWRKFSTYPTQLADPAAWGNIIAIKDPVFFHQLQERIQFTGVTE